MSNKVLPIKDTETINKIKGYYTMHRNNRDLLLFLMSINTGLKLNDLLGLKVKDVLNKSCVSVIDCESRILKEIPLNDEIKELINIVAENKRTNEPLFTSNRNFVLDRSTIFRNFKKMCSELNLPSYISIASLRKTFGWHYYQKNKDLGFLCWLFNQSTIAQTMDFIGVNENISQRYNMEFCL